MASACTTVEEWTEWEGGPCPLRYGDTFDLEYADGLTNTRPRVADDHWLHPNVWKHLGDDSDIARFRVIG